MPPGISFSSRAGRPRNRLPASCSHQHVAAVDDDALPRAVTLAHQIDVGFREIHGEGNVTFVVVTHEDRVSQVAGRVLRLEDGVLKA